MPRRTVLLLILIFLLAASSPAHASFFDDFLSGAKQLFTPSAPQSLTVQGSVQLATDGDLNKNGVIDAGDMVIFKYVIQNPTSTMYQFATLRTNVSRTDINFIHNIKGTSSLLDQKSTIDIPNLFIKPNQDLEVSFEARVNYFDDADHTLFTQPELISSSKQKLFTAPQFNIKAKALPKGRLPSTLFHMRKN